MEEKAKWFEHEVAEVGDCRRELRFEIPAEVVEKELEKIVQQYASRAKIPGFRSGKAPRELVRRRFASEIRDSLIDRLVPSAVEEGLRANHLHPAVDPVIQDLHWQEGEPLKFRAQVDVWPEFELPDYRRIRVTRTEPEVKEEEIQQILAQLQQRAAELIPITERGLAAGDYALLEIKARDLKTRRMQPTQKVQFIAGLPENDPVLEEKILGMKPEETRTFVIDYPPDHRDSRLAGRSVEYTVRILVLREKKVPEINDDFARSLGDFDNLEQLRQRVQEELLARKREEGRRTLVEEILGKIREEISICLPEGAVDEESQALLRRWVSSRPDHPWKEPELRALEAEARRQAEKNLKDRLILKKIAEKEGMAVSEEEVEEELRSLARANRISSFELKERLVREGKIESLRDNLLLRKVVDFLIEQAIMR